MKSYVYVQAIVLASDVSPDGGGINIEGIAFRHAIVHAKNEDEAYSAGFKELGKIPDYGESMNDYVVELG